MEFLYIAFGSLLGIGVTIITDFFRSKKKAKKFLSVVINELQDLQVRLSMYYYLMGTKRKWLKKEDVKWICTVVSDYNGPTIDEELKDYILGLEKISQSQLNAVLEKTASAEYERTELKKLYLPSLQSGLDNLSFLDQKISRALIDLSNEISYYNESIDTYWIFFRKTFESLSDKNHQVVTNNITKSERTLMTAAKAIVKKIEKLDELSREK